MASTARGQTFIRRGGSLDGMGDGWIDGSNVGAETGGVARAVILHLLGK